MERTTTELEHRRTSHFYQEAERKVQHLQKDLKRSIAKSRFENTNSLKSYFVSVNLLDFVHICLKLRDP